MHAPQFHRHIFRRQIVRLLSLSVLLQSPGREPTPAGGFWLSSHPPLWCVVPATPSSAPPPATTLRSIRRIPLIQHTPRPPTIPATNHIPQKQRGATVTSDPAPPAPPNHPPRATWSGCEWRKGGRRERGRKEKGCSPPHRWKRHRHSNHPGTGLYVSKGRSVSL